MAPLLTHCKVDSHHISTQTSYTIYKGIMPWAFAQELFFLSPFSSQYAQCRCYKNLGELFVWRQSREMHNTNSHDYTTPKQQQKKQHQHVKQTIAPTDGNPTAEQASSQKIPQKIMGLLNSLGTDTTSVSVMYISYMENESKTTCNAKWIS